MAGNLVRYSRIKDLLRLTAFLVLMGGASMWLASFSFEEVAGSVRIIDGDSLVVSGREIRLYGIDAPEYRQTCKSNKASASEFPCGKEASSFLRSMIVHEEVTCSGYRTDKYDRLLAICKAGARELNREMVLQGWAVSFGDYESEEVIAKKRAIGLWKGDFDLPSEWRRAEKEKHNAGWLGSLFSW